MKPRIDPSTRTLLEPALSLGPSPSEMAPIPGGTRSPFVELVARTAFSGITIEGIGPVEGASLLHAEAAWPGAGLPEEVVARAAVFGQDAVGIVDVDTVAGVVRAHAEGQERGVRVIPGAELWLDEGPLVLHAASPTGWAHLCEILTEARRGLDKDDVDHRLERVLCRAEGLWALVLPPFQPRALDDLKQAFGPRLSLGVAFHTVPEDKARLAFALEHGARLDIPLVLTARPFLVDRGDKRLHDVITCIRQHLTLETAGQRLLPNARAHMKSVDETIAIARSRMSARNCAIAPWDHGKIDRAISRSREIADACTFELGALRYEFPRTGSTRRRERGVGAADGDEHAESDDQILQRLTHEGARWRYPEGVPDEVWRQLEHELELIRDIGVAAYFLTVKDIVAIARDKGILCQGRGSAANSAVCWCLGITSIDPVRMGLLFERFLSRERAEPPDIDVDFEHERREEVIQAIYEKYGRDHAALVAEVIAYRGRSAVREVGKVHGLTESITGRIADLMLHSSFREMTRGQLRRALVDAGLDPACPRIARTLELSLRLQGHPRHLGIHVGGFVLTHPPITTLGPVEPARMEGRTILPWDKDDVDTLGLFKMDVLGLGMLTCIRKCIELLKMKFQENSIQNLSLATIPAEDSQVYDALCRADSLGVFQVESRAQMAMLPRLKPRCFYDLVVQVAIIRPGPIQGGMVHPYLRRRSGEEAVDYPHESLRPILERTLGVPLFQEQVMKLAIVGAGYTPGEADQLRRDMAAWKKTGRLERHRARLLEGFTRKGISRDFAERLYEQIKGFGEYGFPESHAASFAILVYASSWLKTHHPGFFACALLNSLPMGFYAPSQIVADAQRHGVVVRPADVNHGDWDCTMEDAEQGTYALRLGLRLIHGLREDVGRAIAAERAARGPFVDVSDLVRRCELDKKARSALARAGALDTLAAHRRAAVWSAMDKRPGLLRGLADDDAGRILPAPSDVEVLLLDYATTGLSLDDHPMRHLRDALPAQLGKVLDSRGVQHAPHGTRARTVGLVIGRQRPGTADGTCFVTLEDEHGMVNVIVWGRDFERWRQTVVTAQFLLVDGVVERQGMVVHFIAQRVRVIAPSLGARSSGAAEQIELPFVSRDFH